MNLLSTLSSTILRIKEVAQIKLTSYKNQKYLSLAYGMLYANFIKCLLNIFSCYSVFVQRFSKCVNTSTPLNFKDSITDTHTPETSFGTPR